MWQEEEPHYATLITVSLNASFFHPCTVEKIVQSEKVTTPGQGVKHQQERIDLLQRGPYYTIVADHHHPCMALPYTIHRILQNRNKEGVIEILCDFLKRY